MDVRTISYEGYRDEDLLLPVAAGSTTAFEELYRRYGQKMFSYFFRMLWKNRELAEDQTQELFVKIVRHSKNFEAGRSFSTWLYSIAHNMCKNEYRKAETKMKHAKTGQDTKTEAPAAKNIDLKKFRAALTACLQELSEEKRALFVLRFQEHLSIPEISQVMDIPEGTVKSRLFYLLKEMKEELSEFKTLHLYP